MITDEEKKVILIQKGRGIFRDMVEKKLPEEGPTENVFVTFDYPGTQFEAFLVAEADHLDWGGRRVRAMMRPKGCNRVMSNYIWKGTKQKLLQWLSQEERDGELQKTFHDLADSLAKEDWS